MDGNMKNIIVLKEVPSNLVEEAIVILKENVDLKKHEALNSKKENVKIGAKVKGNSKDYLIKEAESIVSNFISNLEKPKQLEITNRKLEEKYKRVKHLSIFLGITTVFGILINLI